MCLSTLVRYLHDFTVYVCYLQMSSIQGGRNVVAAKIIRLSLEKEILFYCGFLNSGTFSYTIYFVIVGKIGRFTGWGLPDYMGDEPPESNQLLTAAYAPIISNQECSSLFWFIQDSHLCTSGKDYVGYCNGDQGGPLVIDGVQVGIIAGGDRACNYDGGDWPTIHVRIGSYLDWIQENSDYKVHE